MTDDAREDLLAAARRAAAAVPSGLAEDLATAESVTPPRQLETANLVHIYEMRFARWKSSGIPDCDGFPEFMAALRDASDGCVLSSFRTVRNTWLILLSQDLANVVAAVRINEPPKLRPPAADVATGEWS